MLNIINVELIKMRKNKIFIFSSLFVVLISLIVIMVNRVPSPEITPFIWLFSIAYPLNALLSIMSGFIITVLIQREYQDHTLINILTAPVARKEFIISKLITWFIWHIITLFMNLFLFALSSRLIFAEDFQLNEINLFVTTFVSLGLLSFVTSTPLLWIAIKQRRSFFPTVLISLVFATLQMSVANSPIYTAIPWTAVPIISFAESRDVIGISGMIIGLTSIFACGILSIIFSCVSFAKQDQ